MTTDTKEAPAISAATCLLLDGRFVRESDYRALSAENERLRKGLHVIAKGGVPATRPFMQWHDHYQALRSYARAALQEGRKDD